MAGPPAGLVDRVAPVDSRPIPATPFVRAWLARRTLAAAPAGRRRRSRSPSPASRATRDPFPFRQLQPRGLRVSPLSVRRGDRAVERGHCGRRRDFRILTKRRFAFEILVSEAGLRLAPLDERLAGSTPATQPALGPLRLGTPTRGVRRDSRRPASGAGNRGKPRPAARPEGVRQLSAAVARALSPNGTRRHGSGSPRVAPDPV